MRLGDNNSLYEAEIFLIHKALEWIYQESSNKYIKVFSDSLSKQNAIIAFKSINLQVHEIKLNTVIQ